MSNYSEERNLQLVKEYQSGNVEVFQELFESNQGLFKQILHKYRHTPFIDENHKYSSCQLGFLDAIMSFKEGQGRTFGSYLGYCMSNRIKQDIEYLNSKSRKKLLGENISVDANEAIELDMKLAGDPLEADDLYFNEHFPETSEAIEYALEQVKNQNVKPYLLSMTIGDMKQVEVTDITGETKQTVNYQVKAFKSNIKKYMETIKEGLA